MKESLGSILHNTRIQQHLSQKEIADSICSQSMLSAIEHNQYTPNAELLIKLCHKLKINLEAISLSQNYEIGNNQQLNHQLDKLCNHHRYQDMYILLHQPQTIEKIDTNFQNQAYYYYLGITELQFKNNLTEAQKALKFSLANKSKLLASQTLARLTHSSLALLAAKQQLPKKVKGHLQQAFADLNNLPYKENQNIIFYLAAFSMFLLKKYEKAANLINKGIEFTTSHDSHYLLANDYHLLAMISQKTNNDLLKSEAQQRENVFSNLFSEKVFKNL